MLKRISVQQLQVGMYLKEFCCSWMEHPFWRSGFVITDPRDLERIRESRISEVWIDCAKGIDNVPADYSSSVAEVDAKVEAQLKEIALASPPGGDPADGDDYALAAEVCAEAKRVAVAIFAQARLGKAVDTVGAKALVEMVLESVTRNNCALTSLVRLKTASDFTYMHSVAVCALMVTLGRRLGLPRDEVCAAGLGGLLHDLGKAAMPLDVLHKPGRLDDSEYDIIKRHPEEGLRILQDCGIEGAALDVCLNHHSRLDGAGYPQGLRGNEISLYSRMAAVCDVYDAISSGRPYKIAWDPAESMRHMAEWTDGHFDPLVFHAFVKCIGIYPVGSLVRLSSERIGVVVGQSATSLLTPQVKVFFSTRRNIRMPPEIVDLSAAGCSETIEAREDPAKWNFPDLFKLWSGMSEAPW